MIKRRKVISRTAIYKIKQCYFFVYETSMTILRISQNKLQDILLKMRHYRLVFFFRLKCKIWLLYDIQVQKAFGSTVRLNPVSVNQKADSSQPRQ